MGFTQLFTNIDFDSLGQCNGCVKFEFFKYVYNIIINVILKSEIHTCIFTVT